MNKKFSTLLCASLLFSSAFSAVNAVDLTGAAVGVDATAVAKLDKAALSGVYQLRVGTQVLVIEDGKYVLKNVNDSFDLQASLWCVQVTEEGQGKEPIYDFVNKATGEFLAISEEDVVGLQVGGTTDAELSVGETFGGWAFSPEYKENLKGNMPLYTYQEADNVLLLVKGDKGGIKAKKVKASEARSNSTGGAQFTLYDAGTYVLSAAEINAIRVTPWIMIGLYFILTVAELFISPLGLSFVSKVAPPHLQGLMQGCWLAATAVGNSLLFIGGILYTTVPIWACWLVFVGATGASMIVMLSMVKWLERVAK